MFEVIHLTIQGGGVELHVANLGKGPPVVLLHGFPENWRSWRHQVTPLVDAGFSVWIPDLRGYGSSEKPKNREAYHIDHLVADVVAIVKATGHPQIHLVAHDWGGIIAWTFAAKHPELLDRLVILNAPHMGIYRRSLLRSFQSFRSWYVLFFQIPVLPELLIAAGNYRIIRELFKRSSAFSKEEIEGYVKALSQPGALTAALNYYRENFLPNRLKATLCATTSAPTLVIWGERDPFLGLEMLNGLQEFAPRVEILRIPASSHWVQNEKPEEVNAAIVEFFTRPSRL